MAKRTLLLPFIPDNVHWDGKGKLIVAGPNFSASACTGNDCPTGWTVVEVDPDLTTYTRLGGGNGVAAMARASAAIRVGNEIWVANNQDRIARFKAP